MEKDSLEIISNALESAKVNNSGTNIWMPLALIELVVIIGLSALLYRKKKNKKLHFSDIDKTELKEASGDVDIDNIFNSINKSKDLYKELSKKCHPDKFANTPHYETAQEIFQEVNQNKRNYKKLKELNILIEKKLITLNHYE